MRADILNTTDLASLDLFKRASDEAINMMQTVLTSPYPSCLHFLARCIFVDCPALVSPDLIFGTSLFSSDIDDGLQSISRGFIAEPSAFCSVKPVSQGGKSGKSFSNRHA